MMDDIIDLELEKIDAILQKINEDPESEDLKLVERNLWNNIRHKAEEGRRTGIGITAEGDMLAALGLRYGSEDAIDFSEEVHKTVTLEAYRSSVQLAKERGPFAIYNAEREQNNPLINRIRLADPGLYEEMTKFGRRNIALLTIAPTGTTSMMTQTTSGIEPVYMLVYRRRRKVNPNEKEVRVDFVDEVGDHWEEYTVFHHKFKIWMEANGIDSNRQFSQEELEELVRISPYYQATSNDVDWIAKVHMQGRIQKWVDHSISVTINLPSHVTEEMVGKLFFEAWKSGCKGVTVYRDGSRSGVLISEKKEDKKRSPFPTKRPEVLEAEVVRFRNNKEKWVAFIGLIDNMPYEIFTGLSDDEDGILLPRSVTEGYIIKNWEDVETSRYDFQYCNKRGYKTTIEGLSYKFNPVFWNYAKLISGVLRHGMPIHKVVELVTSLQLDNETINSWKAGVARALKKYIPNGTTADDAKCGICGSNDVVYQEGCLKCVSCGSSKCG
jgi:ribonucleoside-diphosphate reductase alpha chain